MSKGNGCRHIKGLISAEPCSRPTNIPKSRPRGRKAAGVKYERDLAEGIRDSLIGIIPLWHGQWFRFIDANGVGVCQPDIILKTPIGIAILESKYTWTEAGHTQLDKLYIPVVEKANPGLPAFGILVCKVMTSDINPAWVRRSLNEAILQAAGGQKTVLHWIGAGLSPLKIAA